MSCRCKDCEDIECADEECREEQKEVLQEEYLINFREGRTLDNIAEECLKK